MTYTYCMYTGFEILLMLDSGPVRNMYSTLWNKSEKQCTSLAFIIRIYHDARSSECQIRLIFSLYRAKHKICNCTLRPRSVFVCFIRMSEQTAIISLYDINWLVSVTETHCVYCAVRTGSLNVISVNFVFKWVVIWFYEGEEIFSHLGVDWMSYILITVERIKRFMPKCNKINT